MSRRRKIIAIAGGCAAGLLVLGLLLVGPIASTVATSVANGTVVDMLGEGSRIGKIRVAPFSGAVTVTDVAIPGPGAPAGGPLISVRSVGVRMNFFSALSEMMVIDEIVVDGLEARIVRDSSGQMNLLQLLEGIPAGQPFEQAISIGEVHVRNATVQVTDETAKEPVTITIGDLVLDAAAIRKVPGASGDTYLGSATITARITPEGGQSGHLGIESRFGEIGTGVPAAGFAVRVVGLDLVPLRPLLPGAAVAAIGGDSIDIRLDGTIADGMLDSRLGVASRGTAGYLTMPIAGPLTKIELDRSSALFGSFQRVGGVLGNVAGSAGDVGVEATKTAAKTVGAVGKGAGGVVKGVGGGLFKVVKGAATGKIDEIGDGVSDASVKAAGDAAGTVGDAAGTVGRGAGKTASAVTGGEDANDWRARVDERWTCEWTAAQEIARSGSFMTRRPRTSPQKTLDEADGSADSN